MASVLDWAGNSRKWREGWRESIPDTAYDGTPFEAMEDAVHLQASRSVDGKLWCFHVEHPDFGPNPRRWKLEAFVADQGTHDELGVRVFCEASPREFIPSNTPALVKSFITEHVILDAGVALTNAAMVAEDEEAYGRFTDLLHASERRLPVVVLSQQTSREADAAYAIKPDVMARALQGLAHVVALPASQATWLSDEVGRDLSVFRGAIRVYMPGFHAHAEKHDHSLYLPDRIETHPSPRSFDKQLARRLRMRTVDSKEKLEAWPRVETEVVATGKAQSLFEGLRRALGLFKRATA